MGGGGSGWLKSFIGLKKRDKDDCNVTAQNPSSLLSVVALDLWVAKHCFFSLFLVKEKTGGGGNGKSSSKWKQLWRGSKSSSHRSGASEAASDISSLADAYTAALAAVVRAPPKDFKVISLEWAAIRIQTAFRAFLVLKARLISLNFLGSMLDAPILRRN